MALDPNKKFLYFNKDSTSTEMDEALCFPVSAFIGIETQTSSIMHFYFEGSKGADATIVQILHEQYAYIKSFMTSLVDEINYGEKAFIRVYDHAERLTHPSDITVNMITDVVPTFTLQDDDVITADDLSVAGDIIGTGADLTLSSKGNLTFQIDSDNDETSQSFLFHNNTSTEIASLNESGKLTVADLDVDDINLNGKVITITGDTDDTFSITTGAAGETVLATTDNASAGGHIKLQADGTIYLESKIGKTVFRDIDNAVDYLQAVVGTHGGATLTTVDAAAGNAHFEVEADGDITLDAAGDIALEAGGGDITGDADNYTFTSATADKPVLTLKNTNTTISSQAELKFLKDAADVAAGESLGSIGWYGDNDAGTPETIQYGKIITRADDVADGQEAGRMYIQVANYDGVLANGVFIDGDTNVDGQVDVTIGAGSASTTTVVGDLTVNGEDHTFTSATSQKPVLTLENSNTDNQAVQLVFKKSAAGADNDLIGNIDWLANNHDSSELINYAQIQGQIVEANDTDEAGKLSLNVARSDGSGYSIRSGVVITGSATDDTINVDLGYDSASTTNVVGDLTVSGDSFIFGELSLSGDVINFEANQTTTSGQAGGQFRIHGSKPTGTDVDGGRLMLMGGASTGTGEGGKVTIAGIGPGSSGSSHNTAYVTRSWDFEGGASTPILQTPTIGIGTRTWVDFNTDTFENTVPSTDSGHSTILRYGPGGTEVVTPGQLFYLHTDGTWNQTDASDVAEGATQMLCVSYYGGRFPDKGALIEGFVRIPSTEILNTPGSGAVDGLPLYVSTTAGHFDFTAPSGNNEYVRCVGYALDDHSGDVLVYFKPDNTYVKITA